MAGPTFVNAGTGSSQGFGSSLALPMPASLVAGNVLIGVVMQGGAAIVWPAGWTAIDSIGIANFDASYAWHLVVSSGDTGPTVTWTGNNSAQGSITQYTGVAGSSPIGAFQQSHGTSALLTAGALLTTGNNSLVVDIELTNAATESAPSGWAQNADVAAAGSQQYWNSVAEASGGTNTPAISNTISGVTSWISFQVELLSAPPPPKRSFATIVG
jgi:hypothetical protein